MLLASPKGEREGSMDREIIKWFTTFGFRIAPKLSVLLDQPPSQGPQHLLQSLIACNMQIRKKENSSVSGHLTVTKYRGGRFGDRDIDRG